MDQLDTLAGSLTSLAILALVVSIAVAVVRVARANKPVNGGSVVVGIVVASALAPFAGQWVGAHLPVDATSAAVAPRLIGILDDGAVVAATAFAAAVVSAIFAWASVKGEQAGQVSRGQVTRGAQVAGGAAWQRQTRKAVRKGQSPITIAGCALTRSDEVKHIAMIGTSGTGKSLAMREAMVGAATRGDRAIIADPDGGFLSRFYDASRGDIILNPFDKRSAAWDMMAEAGSDFAADQLAASLIPDPGGSADSTWAARSRVLLSAILRRGRIAGFDIAEVYRLFAVAPREELQILLAGTAAEPFLAEGATRLFDSVRSSSGAALNALEYIAHAGTVPFSLTRWASSDDRGWVFLPYRADQIAALKPLIGPWLRLAIYATMSRAEGDATPTWFVADELDAIGKIEGLDDALQRVRKFGGRCMLGFQTIGKVRSTYGDGVAAAIVENCSTRLILRCAGGDRNSTAAFASSLIGKQTYNKQTVSAGEQKKGWSDTGTSSGTSTTAVTEDAVLASEIEGLPDLHGYLKAPSSPAWHTVRVPFTDMPQRTPSFVAE